jgi:hypothetical protein
LLLLCVFELEREWAPVDDDGTFRKPFAVLPTYDAVPENVYNGPPIVAALDENA